MQNQLVISRTASVMLFLTGGWLALSPIWISVTGAALTSVIATGSFLALAGVVQYFWRSTLPSWLAGLTAVWLLASAFVFSNLGDSAIWNQALAALVTVVLAFWDGFEMHQVYEPRHLHSMV